MCVFCGRGSMWRTGPQRPVLQHWCHTETLLKVELDRDLSSHTCVHREGAVALKPTTQSREYTEGRVGPDPAWLMSRGHIRVENSGWTSCERVTDSGLEGRIQMLEICFSQPEPFTDRGTQPHLWDYRISGLARPGSGVSCSAHFLRVKKKKCQYNPSPDIMCYTVPRAPIY